MTAKKKPAEPKKQEQTEEQTPAEEPVTPMAVPELTAEERIEALEIKFKVLEEQVTAHNRYHFGGMTGR